MKIEVVFEDRHLLIYEKPAGIHSVRLGKEKEGCSLAGLLLNENPKSAFISKNAGDAGLVNRLDLETSGLIIAAKTKDSWIKLHELFTKSQIEKHYCAVLDGIGLKAEIVDNFIGKSGRNSKKVKVFSRKPAARYCAMNAVSYFSPIMRYKKTDTSIWQIKIQTGRRHQIRAHAGYIKRPLCGDKLYGSKNNLGTEFKLKQIRPFFLHAWKYKFKHPYTGKIIYIESKAEDLLSIIE